MVALLHARYNYHVIFSDVCKTRFNHLATRICVTVAFTETLISLFVSQHHYSVVQLLFLLPAKFLLFYLVFLSVAITRKNYMHVQFIGYSNLITHVFGQLFAVRTVVYQVAYSFGAFLISLATSDWLDFSSISMSKYYATHICILAPLVYTIQHSVFDMDKLSFNFDVQVQFPQEYILNRVSKMFMKSGVLTLFVTITSPFFLYATTSHWFIDILSLIKISILSFLIFANFEFINIAFNAHMSIGCLHKGKPISSLSSTPMITLASGLSSKRSFTKLTAFQELCYRATSPNTSLRQPLYEASHLDVQTWSHILAECLNVIRESNDSVTRYLQALEKSVESVETTMKANRNTPNVFDNNDNLFGNQPSVTSGIAQLSVNDLPGSSEMSTNNNLHHRITLKNDNVLLKHNRTQNPRFMMSPTQIGKARSFNDPILSHQIALAALATSLIQKLKQSVSSFFFPSATEKLDYSPQFSIIQAWCISKRRQAEKLVPLPVCHADCIVSLTGLLINAHNEDPKGGIISSIGEILKCLERSVGALGKFAEWDPNAIPTENKDPSEQSDVISILYDLSISAFLEIVLKYNVLLEDIYLDPDVIKLSKWVLDMCNT